MCTDHVDSTLTLSTTVYTMPILFLLIFPDVLTIFISITIFGNVHRPCQEYPTLSITVSSFFFWFFFKFSGYICINYHIRKCTQTMPTVSHIVNNSLFFFFLIFPDFLAIFALITILGNAHRPCKHYPSIVNNSICHVYSVSPIFPNFLAIFALITIFSNAHRPCSQCPNTITNNEHHP